MAFFKNTEAEAYSTKFAHANPPEIIAWGLETFGQGMTLLCGIGPSSGVLLHMTAHLKTELHRITLDTLVLHPETYELLELYKKQYSVHIEQIKPTKEDLAELPGHPSLELFVGNETVRKLCCDVRKGRPLARALAGCPAYLTGLRPDAALSDRDCVPIVQIDHAHGGIVKINPLARWSDAEIWDYVFRHNVPYHSLYDRGYGSIGCGNPCTVPGPGRSGRWWWLKERSEAHCKINLTDGTRKP